ncbi:MAG: DUF6058 family natural product biosynthesis protein [Tetrasphaera sp.]
MTDPGKAVLEEYLKVNGTHEMQPVDDEYARRLFAELGDITDLSRVEALQAIRAEQIPLPSYVLADGATMMVYPDLAGQIATAGGADKLRAWFLGHWEENEQAVAAAEWDAFQSGQYVCLREVTPKNIQTMARSTAAIAELTQRLDDDPEDADARAALRSAVDQLDLILLPMTGYDRQRFDGPLVRESQIDRVRSTYLQDDDSYRMSLSLNVLNHLGINLYSNLPAVLSEAVANAWDADATRVDIDIDPKNDIVTVSDNGIGMTRREINQRYLNVGYRRREDQHNVAASSTMRNRPVMGRKGIGKLSLFSIAKTITVQSRARRPIGDTSATLQRAALELDLDAIMDQIKGHDVATYEPTELTPRVSSKLILL